jgi:hypothetical protein
MILFSQGNTKGKSFIRREDRESGFSMKNRLQVGEIKVYKQSLQFKY